MSDTPTPLDLDAIRAAVGDLDAASSARLSYVAAQVPALVAEVERLRAEVRLAKESARSAGLALGAHLSHPSPIRAELEQLRAEVAYLRREGDRLSEGNARLLAEVARLEEDLSDRTMDLAEATHPDHPAPTWDEEVVRGALVDAQLASACQMMHDGYPSIVIRSNEDAADTALAVVREHLPIKPAREDIYRAWHGTDDPWGGCADSASIERVLDLFKDRGAPVKPDREAAAQMAFEAAGRDDWGVADDLDRDEWFDVADAVLALFPGRSEAEVKEEAVHEVADFLDSQTGDREIVASARLAAQAVRWWQAARADRLEGRS